MKVKKEYKNTIKDTLKCYKLLLSHIDALEEQIKEAMIFDGVAGIDYAGDGIKTNNINKLVENTALKNIEDVILIKENLEKAKSKLSRLDAAIAFLDMNEKQVVIYRYVEGIQWFEVVEEMKYSERHCKLILEKAISKLAYTFYGDRAFNLSTSLKIQ